MPRSTLMSVVFPAPLGPSRPKTSPSPTLSEMPSSARTGFPCHPARKVLRSSSVWITDGLMILAASFPARCSGAREERRLPAGHGSRVVVALTQISTEVGRERFPRRPSWGRRRPPDLLERLLRFRRLEVARAPAHLAGGGPGNGLLQLRAQRGRSG